MVHAAKPNRCGGCGFQRQRDVDGVVAPFDGAFDETERTQEVAHGAIVGQHARHDLRRALRLQVGDQLGHQDAPEAAALEVGADHDRELGAVVVGVGHRAHHAERFLALLARAPRPRRRSRGRSRSG